jgi:hypothetical protein
VYTQLSHSVYSKKSVYSCTHSCLYSCRYCSTTAVHHGRSRSRSSIYSCRDYLVYSVLYIYSIYSCTSIDSREVALSGHGSRPVAWGTAEQERHRHWHGGKLPQYKLIHVQRTKKSTRAPVSPVTQAQKRRFFVSNGSVTPRKESFAKQTQVMLLGRWSPDNIASHLVDIGVKLEPWLRRYSRKKEAPYTKGAQDPEPRAKVRKQQLRVVCTHVCTVELIGTKLAHQDRAAVARGIS